MIMHGDDMRRYRYTESGLDNVIIENADFIMDDSGEEVICVPAVNLLHRTIAEGILRRKSRLSGPELRFLRTEMGLTQDQLADLLHTSPDAVAQWEEGTARIEGAAETVLRLLASERLGIDLGERVETVARWSAPSSDSRPIVIRRTEDGYELENAA